MLMRRPLELRTTRTGFPARQFLDSAPNLSLSGASQLRASALQKGQRKEGKEGIWEREELLEAGSESDRPMRNDEL